MQSQSFRLRNVCVRLDRMRIVFEPAEPEVGKQGGADRLVESRRQAVIVNDRAAAKSSDSTTGAAQSDTQIRFSCKAVVGPRVTAKDMQIPGRLVVTADVKRVSVKRTGARTEKVIRQVGVNRGGEKL